MRAEQFQPSGEDRDEKAEPSDPLSQGPGREDRHGVHGYRDTPAEEVPGGVGDLGGRREGGVPVRIVSSAPNRVDPYEWVCESCI
jgi:hypothetical protein